jgi:hypothetical protein
MYQGDVPQIKAPHKYTLLHREGHPTRAVASSTSQVKHGDNMVKKSNKKRRYPTSAGHAAHAGVDAGPRSL